LVALVANLTVFLGIGVTIPNRIVINFARKGSSLFWQNVELKTEAVWVYIVGLLSEQFRGCTRTDGFEFVTKNALRFMKRS